MSYFARRPGSLLVVAAPLAALSLVTVGCSSSGEPTLSSAAVDEPQESELMSAADFAAYISDNPEVPLINVHIPYEGHLAGTDAFVAFDSILDSAELPADRSDPIALYCRSGNMSAQATADLVEAGYTNVVDLDGGMNAWVDTGESLLDDPAAAEN